MPDQPTSTQHAQGSGIAQATGASVANAGDRNVIGYNNIVTNNITYQQITPRTVDDTILAAATAKLAELPVDHIPAIAALPPASRMPLPDNPLFVGREANMRALAAALKGNETVAVGQIAATTGLGGIGKTQLAVAFVYRYGQFFRGGVLWLNMADANSVPLEIAACGESMLDLRKELADKDLITQVKIVMAAWQSSLPRLLVFDNC